MRKQNAKSDGNLVAAILQMIDEILNSYKYPDIASAIASFLYKRLFSGSLGWNNRDKLMREYAKSKLGCGDFAFEYTMKELTKDEIIVNDVNRHRYILHDINPKTMKLVEKYLNSMGIDRKTFLSFGY